MTKGQTYGLRSFCVRLNNQLLQYYFIRLWKTICIYVQGGDVGEALERLLRCCCMGRNAK